MSGPVKVQVGSVALSVPANQTQHADVSVPKVSYLPPTAGQSSSAWASNGAFLDYELPKSVGVLHQLHLRFQLNNTTQEDGVAVSVPAPCIPYWIQQAEIYVGSTQVEVIYPNDLFNEVVGFKTNEELVTEGGLLACASGDVSAAATTPALSGSVPTGTSYFYLPLPNCLTACKLYVAGSSETVKFRIYFPPNLFPSTVTCVEATLVIEEDVLSRQERLRYASAHQTGMVYSTIVRCRQNQTISKSGTSDYTLELTGLQGASAGLLVYAGPSVVPSASGTATNIMAPSGSTSVNANRLLTQRYPITTSLELDDTVGSKRTEELRTDELATFTWFDHVATSFAKRYPVYILPFCSGFRNTVSDGVNRGSINLHGNDRLVIRGTAVTNGNTAATETWNITVVNYCYQSLVFKGGRLTNILRKVNGD